MRSSGLGLLLWLVGCVGEEHVDEADLCFVSASEEIVVEVSWPCASDHRGAELSCDMEVEEDGTVRVESVFVEGRDPNDACAEPLVAECTSPPLEDGMHSVRHGDDTFEITVPSTPQPACGDG